MLFHVWFTVFAIDIDPKKIELARNNARVYGVEDRIEFIVGDFFKVSEKLIADVVFLSPPWGGPGYVKEETFDLNNIIHPIGGTRLFKAAKRISDHVAYFLPRNVDTIQVKKKMFLVFFFSCKTLGLPCIDSIIYQTKTDLSCCKIIYLRMLYT